MTKKKQDVINDVGDEPMPVKAQAPTLPPDPIPGLAIGRVVHYVLAQDEHRRADITRVVNREDGLANLAVTFDGPNDGRSEYACVEWLPNIEYSEFHVVGTWHFIEKA
jgi:hypothetical protein